VLVVFEVAANCSFSKYRLQALISDFQNTGVLPASAKLISDFQNTGVLPASVKYRPGR